MITTVVFSFNRALQLDGVLRSFFLHCQDAESTSIVVLYKTRGEKHTRQYATLSAEYAAHGNVRFVAETDFRRDLLAILGWTAAAIPPGRIYRLTVGLGPRLAPIANRLSPPLHDDFILFLVDDNIFVRDFRLRDAEHTLQATPTALGFSLRLGRNTTYSYVRAREQGLPSMTECGDGILYYTWPGVESDFGYPLEVSSSLYRSRDIVPLLHRLPFRNPNTLEAAMAGQARKWQTYRPGLLCFAESVTFCNPINMVQTIYANRASNQPQHTADALADLFDDGRRLDARAYSGLRPTGCHQEAELLLADLHSTGAA